MTIIVPDAPVTVTAAVVKSVFNVKTDEDAQRVLDLATTYVNRALSGAFRTMDQITYDDVIRRVVGTIVGARKRPSGGNGQLTTVEQNAPAPVERDYLYAVRSTLAQYVAPL